MTRRCSHCTNKGHNSRTCPSRGGGSGSGSFGGVKLFGVRLTDGSMMKKSASMGNLSAHYHSSSSAAGSPNPESPSADEPDGYLSDDPVRASCSANRRADRKKGVPWTEEEHRLFLMGLQKLGKGDWRGIARNYVVSRTPTQVASHAQKYFIRQTNATRRKRRSSLFDMVTDMASDTPPVPEELEEREVEPDSSRSQPSLNLSLLSEFDPMEASHEANPERVCEPSTNMYTNMMPGFYMPIPFPLWPPSAVVEEEEEKPPQSHQVLRPIPVMASSVNVDELVSMSQLNLGDGERGNGDPLKWLGDPSRQSAFQSNPPVAASDLSEGKSSAIQAL